MSRGITQKLRLDQILVREGLVSDVQVKEALMRQKAHGGKFGSQLLYHRCIDEAGLVRALAIQSGCDGVVLSDLEIHPEIMKMIPGRLAIARKIMPFDYEPDGNVLKIACVDPNDQNLLNELKFTAKGKNIKLFVAAEIALDTVIARNYQGRNVTLEDNLLLDIPDTATDTAKIAIELRKEAHPETWDKRGSVLLVTDEEFSGPLIQSLLERDGYEVKVTDSADDAIEILGDKRFDTVFIKDTVPGDYLDLIDRVRKVSPRTAVRYYETASTLVLQERAGAAERELLIRNLDLFTSLLATKEKLPTNHSGTVGHYVDKLCARLKLPERDRITITNAAFLHDLARFYYNTDGKKEYREVINLTVKLLQSLNYSPVIIEMLRSMYINLGGKYTKRLPIEVLGGNILTIVDLFCDNIPLNQRLSLDKFDAIKRKFRDLVGKLFLGEVVEAFIVMIQEEILSIHTVEKVGQVMLYADHQDAIKPVELRLKNEGFRTVIETSASSFYDLYNRSKPDMIVLIMSGELYEISSFVERLAAEGFDLRKVPTFLLAPSTATSQLTSLFDQGIEDIIANDINLDFLVIKMQKIQARLEAKARERGEAPEHPSGAHGRLVDMNLIDLLQALGPSRKTVRIAVTSSINNDKLTMYLRHGDIIFAHLGDKLGADAVYDSLGWSTGTWVVEPVGEENLPEMNNELSNESILMEGCRLIDERVREGQLL